MAFELVTPGHWGPNGGGGLPEGMISLQKSGLATVRIEDLVLVGIPADAGKVAVLACSETNRIAIRRWIQEEHGDSAFAIRAPTKQKGVKNESVRMLNLNAPLKRLGIKPEAYAGRYELHTKDDLLLLNLVDLNERDKKLARPHPDHLKKLAEKAAKK